MTISRALRLLPLALTSAFLLTCAREPEIHFLSNEEFDEVWKSAESRTPIGEPTIRRSLEPDGTVTVTCQQAFALRMNNGGGQTAGRCCEMSCQLTPGAKLSDCNTSGCGLPFDDSPPSDQAAGCTAGACSGGCITLRACSPCPGGPIIVARRPA